MKNAITLDELVRQEITRHGVSCAKAFDAYLSTAPFGVAHFEMLRVSNEKPEWAQLDDCNWARELSKTGASIGMDDNDLRRYAVEQYVLRKVSETTRVDESYSVGDLVLG